MAMFEDKADRPITSLISDLMTESSTLVRKEIALAKAEMSEKVSQVGNGVISLVAGALIAFAALLVLLFALVDGVSDVFEIDGGWAALIVGIVTAVIGYVLVQKGLGDLKMKNLAPERTVESLRRDTEIVKGQTR